MTNTRPTSQTPKRSLLVPDRYFSRITSIDIRRDLLDAGLTGVLLDIDNTIRRRDTHEIPRDVGMWMGRAREAGVKFCLLSNNWHATAYQLAGELDLPIVAKACKPLPFAFMRAMGKIGTTRADTVVIGDQLLTDVVGAHLAGLTAYMLQPLVSVDIRSTAWQRELERILLGTRQPESAETAIVHNCEE